MWKDLTMKERAALIKLGVDNGVTNLEDIRDSYNQYKKGEPLKNDKYNVASLVDSIYENSKGEKHLGEPSHHYDVALSDEEAERLGFYRDERGHMDDRVKKKTCTSYTS